MLRFWLIAHTSHFWTCLVFSVPTPTSSPSFLGNFFFFPSPLPSRYFVTFIFFLKDEKSALQHILPWKTSELPSANSVTFMECYLILIQLWLWSSSKFFYHRNDVFSSGRHHGCYITSSVWGDGWCGEQDGGTGLDKLWFYALPKVENSMLQNKLLYP